MKALIIEDPEAHRIAAAIAERTGESLTQIVTGALGQRFEEMNRVGRKAGIEELHSIAKCIADHAKGPYVNHAELLYDKHGLPK